MSKHCKKYANYLWNKKKGSYTVEAAIIIPAVIGVILFVLYICIYSYDRIAIHHAVLAELYSDMENMSEDDKREYLTESISGKIRNNTIADWEIEIHIEIYEDVTIVDLNGHMGNNQSLLASLVNTDYMGVKIHYSKYK